MRQPEEIKKKKRSEFLPEPIYATVQDILASQPISRIDSAADTNRARQAGTNPNPPAGEW